MKGRTRVTGEKDGLDESRCDRGFTGWNPDGDEEKTLIYGRTSGSAPR